MSSYWGAVYGTALVLSEEEFSAFLEKYSQKNQISIESIVEKINEDLNDLSEYEFIRSTPYKKEPFNVTYVTTDKCDGMRLTPYWVNGHPNVWNEEHPEWHKDFISKDLRAHNVYAIFTDKLTFKTMNLFGEAPAYSSYEDILTEFMDMLYSYMPEDFDWDAHIGAFHYAEYA